MKDTNYYNPLPDALYAISVDEIQSPEQAKYGRGLLVGLISGLMAGTYLTRWRGKDDPAGGWTSEFAAFTIVSTCLEHDIRIHPDCIPVCWEDDFEPAIASPQLAVKPASPQASFDFMQQEDIKP